MRAAVLVFLFTSISLLTIEGLVELKNIECYSLDKSFSDFEYCYIRAVNRTYKYASLKIKLFKKPINNLSVSVDVRRKGNGYKPWLYNVTFDTCKFMRTKGNPVIRYFYSFYEKYSNMNHTCPYNHDLILDKLDSNHMNNLVTQVLPVPKGQYGIFSSYAAYNVRRGHANLFLTIS